MKRLDEIDFVRGICIIYMILGHIVVNNNFDHYIHAFHMPLFYVVSGYFASRGMSNFWYNIKKLFKKLIIPYIIWGLIFSIFYSYISNRNLEDALNYMKLLFTYNDTLPFAGALWFLTSFFFSSIIFKLFNYIKNDFLFILVCIGTMLLGIYYNRFLNLHLLFSIQSALVGVGFMAIGYLFKKNNLFKKLFINDLFLLILLSFIEYLLIMKTGYVNMRSSIYPNPILLIINIIFSLIVYLSFAKVIKNNFNNLYSKIIYIGENSIYFLILNQFIIYIIQKIFSKYGLDMFISNDIHKWFIIGYLVTSFIYIISKYILKTKFRLIFGKR